MTPETARKILAYLDRHGVVETIDAIGRSPSAAELADELGTWALAWCRPVFDQTATPAETAAADLIQSGKASTKAVSDARAALGRRLPDTFYMAANAFRRDDMPDSVRYAAQAIALHRAHREKNKAVSEAEMEAARRTALRARAMSPPIFRWEKLEAAYREAFERGMAMATTELRAEFDAHLRATLSAMTEGSES